MKENGILLDILELHYEEDKDPKTLILAKGENLNREISSLICELEDVYSSIELVNLITNRNQIGITLKTQEINLGKIVKRKLELKKKTKPSLARKMHVSGKDLNHFLGSTRLPSCRKLTALVDHLGSIDNLVIGCKKRDFCLQKLHLIYNTIHQRREEFPLFVLNNLLEIWKISFNIPIEYYWERKISVILAIDSLQCNQVASEAVKCPKLLDVNFARIIGGFCADGSLSEDYMIRWEEEHHSNLVSLKNSLKLIFRDVEVVHSGRERNSYTIKFRSKVISRYLTTFFEVAPGKKSRTTRCPSIIRKSSLQMKKAFAQGVMTFDGSANCSGSVSLGVRSKLLRDDVAEIMNELNIDLRIYGVSKKTETELFYCFATNNNTDLDQRAAFVHLFEKNTIKWQKMKEFSEGFSQEVSNQEDAVNYLKLFFYKNRSIDIEKKFLASEKIRIFTIYALMKEISYKRGTLTGYLGFLCKTNILSKEREKRSTYTFNPNIDDWRVPSTKYYQTLKVEL